MANDARLKIIIETMNNASKELKQLQGDLNSVDQAGKDADKSTGTFGENLNAMKGKIMLAAAAVAGVGVALKQTYEIAREGAELEFTASKFDNLTAAIGTTTDALMIDLRAASDGTLSDMELMASATDFMSLGLAKNHDEVVRLSTVASQLNMDMNQLVLTLTNQTTMRFDALGVSVAGFDEKVKALEKSGLSAEEAFNEAFLQQAEEQIARVGSATDESIGSFMRLESAWKNVVDEGKKRLVPVFADVAEALATMLTVIPDNEDALERLNDQVMDGTISHEQYKTAVENLLDPLHISIDEHGNLTSNMRGAEDATAALMEHTIYYTKEALAAAQATAEWDEHEKRLADQYNNETIPAINEAKDATNNAEEAMRTYTEALLFKIASEGLSEDAALELAYAMGLVDERTVFATKQIEIWSKMLEDKKITQREYNDLVAGLNRELEGLPKDVKVNVKLNITGQQALSNVSAQLSALGGSVAQDYNDNPDMKASGGNVYTGNPYIWQEYSKGGGEVLVPSMDGYILSRSDAAAALASGGKSGSTTTYNLIINEAGGVVDPVGSIALLEAMAGG